MSAALVRLPAVSGPVAGALAAAGLLVVHLAGIRWGIGIDGLGSLGAVNDEVIAVTAPLILQGLIGAAAVAGCLTVPPAERRTGVLDGPSEKALAAVGVFCAVVLPLVAGRPLLGAAHSASLFWLGCAALAAVAAGMLLALAVVRGRVPVAVLVVVAGLPLVTMAGQALLGWVLLPSSGEAPGLSGEELARAGEAMGIGRMVLTAGVMAVVTGVARVRTGARWWWAPSAALAMVAVGMVLALPGAGLAAAGPYGPGFWAAAAAGCAVGYVVTRVAATTIGPRRRRPAESRLDRERGDHP